MQSVLQEKYREPIPIVFMTADEREEDESLGLENSAMDYIRKPFKPEVLPRRVGNIMRHVENVERIQGLRSAHETDPMTGPLNKAHAQKVLAETEDGGDAILARVLEIWDKTGLGRAAKIFFESTPVRGRGRERQSKAKPPFGRLRFFNFACCRTNNATSAPRASDRHR